MTKNKNSQDKNLQDKIVSKSSETKASNTNIKSKPIKAKSQKKTNKNSFKAIKKKLIKIDLSKHTLPIVTFLTGLLLAIAMIVSSSLLFLAIKSTQENNQEIYDKINKNIESLESGLENLQPNGKSLNLTTTIDDDATQGNKNTAKVAIVEFSDFNCPYCSRFHTQTLDKIIKKYVDKGQVLYVYRDFPGVGGQKTAGAAGAMECLREQAGDVQYFKTIKTIYQSTASIDKDFVLKQAQSLDIDQNALKNCTDSGKYISEVNKDRVDAIEAGVRGTPAFVVGVLEGVQVRGVKISGAESFERFDQVIKSQLAKTN